MPEVIEQPPKVEPAYVPPPEPPQLKVKAGDVFREQFEKLSKAEPEPKTEDPPTVVDPKPEPVKEEPKPEVKPEEKSAAEIPKSPLDVVTADKKPEVKTEEPDEFDEKNPDWKRARERIKQQKEEKKALEATIAELKKTPKTDPEEVARLTKEREDLKASLAEREELIKSVDVRLSDEYRTLAKKRDDTVGKIATRAKSYGVDPDALVSALALPEGKFRTEQIKGIMAEVEPEDKARIMVLVETLEGHNEAIQEFEKDAPKKYEEIKAKREAAVREQQEASIKTVHAEFVKLSETLPNDVVTLREVPDDVPGGTEWNQAIKSARETALRVLSPGGSDFNETGAIALKGAHYDALKDMFLKDHAELIDARRRLAEYDGGGPDFKGGEKPKAEAKLTPVQKFYKTLEAAKSSNND